MFNLNKYYEFLFCILLVACGGDSSSISPENQISSSSEFLQENSSDDLLGASSGSEGQSSSSIAIASSDSEGQSSSSIAIASSDSEGQSSSSIAIASSDSEELSSSSQIPLVMSIYDSVAQTLTDLRDNHIYKTVVIGQQVWMAENMNYKYKSGSKSFCYNNETKYCNSYGRLYTSDSKNFICPEKWHLPDSTEWETLFEFTGCQAIVLKADSGWIPFGTEDTNGTNDFGLSVYAVGYRNLRSEYTSLGLDAHFWVRNCVWVSYIPDVNRIVPGFDISDQYKALPIRCIKDN